jgi:hypothetical protein
MTLEKLPNKTYPALGLSLIDRAFKEAHAERCPLSALGEIKAYFEADGGLRCVYCGDESPSRWDHFFPVSKGGDTVPGNLVPSCARCDDSKQHKTLEEWFSSRATHKPPENLHDAIVMRIARYQKHFGYTERPFLEKIDEPTREKYERLTTALQTVRDVLRADGIIN